MGSADPATNLAIWRGAEQRSGRRAQRSGSGDSRVGDLAIRGPMRRDDLAVGQQLPGVIEEDDAITEQAPTLLWVVSHSMGRLPVRRFGRRARRLMLALHSASVPPFICVQRCSSLSLSLSPSVAHASNKSQHYLPLAPACCTFVSPMPDSRLGPAVGILLDSCCRGPRATSGPQPPEPGRGYLAVPSSPPGGR
jgi:hypothetical protein